MKFWIYFWRDKENQKKKKKSKEKLEQRCNYFCFCHKLQAHKLQFKSGRNEEKINELKIQKCMSSVWQKKKTLKTLLWRWWTESNEFTQLIVCVRCFFLVDEIYMNRKCRVIFKKAGFTFFPIQNLEKNLVLLLNTNNLFYQNNEFTSVCNLQFILRSTCYESTLVYYLHSLLFSIFSQCTCCLWLEYY